MFVFWCNREGSHPYYIPFLHVYSFNFEIREIVVCILGAERKLKFKNNFSIKSRIFNDAFMSVWFRGGGVSMIVFVTCSMLKVDLWCRPWSGYPLLYAGSSVFINLFRTSLWSVYIHIMGIEGPQQPQPAYNSQKDIHLWRTDLCIEKSIFQIMLVNWINGSH